MVGRESREFELWPQPCALHGELCLSECHFSHLQNVFFTCFAHGGSELEV